MNSDMRTGETYHYKYLETFRVESMLDFESYYKQTSYHRIDEGAISTIANFVKKALASAISKLGFGKRTRIKIDTSPMLESIERQMGIYLSEEPEKSFASLLRRHNGMFNEAVVAREIIKIARRDGGVDPTTDEKEIDKEYEYHRKIILDAGKKFKKEDKAKETIELSKKSGKILAETMMNDIFNDPKLGPLYKEFLLVKPILTGKTMAGVTKADLWLEVYHVSKSEMIDRIEASLKSYKGKANVQLLGTTYLGVMNALFMGEDAVPLNWAKFKTAFVKKYGRGVSDFVDKLFVAQHPAQNRADLLPKELAGASDKEVRSWAKKWDIEGSKTLIGLFDYLYKNKNNREQINLNILKALGLHSEDNDTIYASFANLVLSGRSNKEYRNLLKELNTTGFTASISIGSGKGGGGVLTFKSMKGATLLKTNIAQTRSGRGALSYQFNANFKAFIK